MNLFDGSGGTELKTVPGLICGLCNSPVYHVEDNAFSCQCHTWRLVYHKPIKTYDTNKEASQ